MRALHINANYLYTNLHQCMTRALTEQGVDNQVFVSIYTRDNLVVTPDENVKVSVCYKKWDRFFFYKKQKKIRNALEANVNVSDFDLLHAYTLFTDGNCAYELSKKYNIPYVVAVRATDVNAFFKWMPHLRGRGVEIMKNASRVFFLSTTYRDYVIDKYVPEKHKDEILKKSMIIPNGIDDFWFENPYSARDVIQTQRRFADKQVNIVFAGRINQNKNPLATLKAMDILEKKGYKVSYTVVGGFEDASIKKVLLSDKRVHYAGKLAKNDLIEQYRMNDIFVMPSYQESFGLVYAEVMSQGLPVIYTKGQGFDGQFPEGEVGYSVKPHSPEDVAEAIKRTMNHYAEISSRCLKNIDKFRWTTICETYRSVYQEVCGVNNDE